MAKDNIKIAQECQKEKYDHKIKSPKFKVGDRVFVHMPAAKACKGYKFARPLILWALLDNRTESDRGRCVSG